MTNARLTRSENDKIIAGVCGGLAAYLEIDTIFVRLAFLILLFASGIGFALYFILWIIMPQTEGDEIDNAAIIQKNISEMGTTVSDKVNRLGRPGTAGLLLILFGAYFLMQEFGWLGSFSGTWFWPLLLIGIGVFMLARRSR